VHPSVYFLLFFHTCSLTPLDERENELQKSLAAYERKMLGVKEGLVTDYGFWAASDPARGHMPDKRWPIRALVCGDAGVGKSTLINKVFGVSSLVRMMPSPNSKVLLITDNWTGRTFRPRRRYTRHTKTLHLERPSRSCHSRLLRFRSCF
jgi:hypothetical protein